MRHAIAFSDYRGGGFLSDQVEELGCGDVGMTWQMYPERDVPEEVAREIESGELILACIPEPGEPAWSAD